MNDHASGSTKAVSSETLNLSASMFTSSIDAWIPANWGKKVSDIDRAREMDKALKTASSEGENARLGVGHPEIGKPKNKGPSLSALEKRLGKVDKKVSVNNGDGSITAKGSQHKNDSEEDDAEESRSRSVGVKRKNAHLDLLSVKKKAKSKPTPAPVQPLLNLDSPASRPSSSQRDADAGTTDGLSLSTESGDLLLEGSVALTSPRAKAALLPKPAFQSQPENDAASDADGNDIPDESHGATTTGSGKMTKAQKRREHRRRVKLAKQNGE